MGDGSPPRAWGRRVGVFYVMSAQRFTPTCVGTAKSLTVSGSLKTVHPHVRGDGKTPRCPMDNRHGSPPRAWGRQKKIKKIKRSLRFTPTCVGTASFPPPLLLLGSVHPHVRGDGVTPCRSVLPAVGSPPRAWGRRDQYRMADTVNRFTPTCVGTARPKCRSASTASVHPHVRGDGLMAIGWLAVGHGSPPRAWGRPGIHSLGLRRRRFTPTCVGTARHRRYDDCVRSVHPHVRGDG